MKSIMGIVKEIRKECKCSNVLLEWTKGEISVRSINGVRVFAFIEDKETELREAVDKIKSSRLSRSVTDKLLSLLICCCFFVAAKSQFIGDPYHNWNFSYGRTGTPGDQFKLGIEYARTPKSAIYGEAGYERSRYQSIHYSSLSLLLGGRYYLVGNTYMSAKKKINVVGGLGAVAQYEAEPSVYKSLSFSERVNYGVSGQVLGEYFYDPTIGLFGGFEQKVLFRETLGKYNYSFFMGLRIHFASRD